MKVAYYSPLPPERSGIADYSGLLLPALRERIDVEVVRRGARRFPRRTDVALYQVGNNPDAHGWIVEALRRRRGVVDLHDFVLHHLIAGITLGRGDRNRYLDAMQREGGPVGRMLAHGVIDGVVPPLWETRADEYPLAGEALQYATGVVVHSRYVEDRVRSSGFLGPIWRIPLPAWPAPGASSAAVLPRPASPVIGCYGNLTPAKRLPQLFEAFAGLRARFPEALLLLVGAAAPRFELQPLFERFELEPGKDVLHLDYVAEPELISLIRACDVCVNLRWPTMGETSAAAIQALTLGRPLVVSDVGWFAELPDSVVAKVPVDDWEVATLRAVLERLSADAELRARMGSAAVEYVRREHDLGRVADAYVAALEEAAGGRLVRDAVLWEVAAAANEVGLEASSPELEDVGKALREVGLGG